MTHLHKQFQFNEDVGGLFVNLIAAYLMVFFTLGIATWAFCSLKDESKQRRPLMVENKI